MNFVRASIFAAGILSAAAVLGQSPAPAVRILEPDNGAYVSGEILVRAALEPPDQPVDRLAFFVDGRLVCTVERPPFECSWNGGTGVRAHLFRVVAYLPGGGRLVRIARTKGVEYADAEDVEMVHVTVTVLDGNGQFVRGLPRDAFKVFEDGVAQPINYFAAEASPLELVIAVDISGSMVGAIDRVKENVKSFVSALRPADRVTLVLFNENFFVLTRPSVDLGGRLKALDRLAPWGSTSLYEALVRSFDLLGRQARRRGLVVFTDGDDTSSRIPRAAVERRSETSDAVVYVIGQGRAVQSAGLKELCGRLATTSGGRAFFPGRIEDLRGAFDAILEEMSNQYLLSYAPPSPSRDATFHRIRVQVSGGYQVRARQGYRMR
jgi:VWFA-related protein